MRFPKLLLMLIVAAGCSNSKTGSDENAASTEIAASYGSPEETKLTAQEMQRLREELFHYLRENEAYIGGPVNYVQHESIILHPAGFQYVASYSPGKDDPYDESDELYISGDIDSIVVDGKYRIVSANRNPEGGIQEITIEITGSKILQEWQEYQQYSYDYGGQVSERLLQRSVNELHTKSVTFNIQQPRIYSRQDLYLKLRITDITDKDVSGYSKDELGYLRNEVFARHGHTFKTPKMIAYFDTQDWYRAFVDDATPFLNDIEKKNIEFLKSKEAS